MVVPNKEEEVGIVAQDRAKNGLVVVFGARTEGELQRGAATRGRRRPQWPGPVAGALDLKLINIGGFWD